MILSNHWKKHLLPYSNGLIIKHLKNNPAKCHLLVSSDKNITVKIGEYEIENSECEKLFGVS